MVPTLIYCDTKYNSKCHQNPKYHKFASEIPSTTNYDKKLVDLPSETSSVTVYEERSKNSTQFLETNWLDESVEFRNYYMRYRPQLDPVLSNLNFTINAGEKIGIVGRTGAGKSSIIQALFRMTEGEQGSEIIIGGCNTRLMGLHSLRNNLSIIPQIPFLFKGSIRENLDPLNQKSDQELYKALEESDLRGYVESLPNKLDTEISNASEILSVGQKQLMYLARAILRNNKILVLDEATSNVDMRTDDFIQKTLKTKFKGQTIITIAHRLNTIADYDRVIVIDKGRVIQIGTPFELLAKDSKDKWINKEGTFAQMVKSTGQNAQIIFSIARNKHLFENRYLIITLLVIYPQMMKYNQLHFQLIQSTTRLSIHRINYINIILLTFIITLVSAMFQQLIVQKE